MPDPSCIWCGEAVTPDDSFVRISPAQWLHVNNLAVDCCSAHRAWVQSEVDGSRAA